jgi:hypothetical protein
MLVKEFLHAITHFNPKIIKLIVWGVLIFMIKKIVAEMLNLLKINITKLLAK